VVYHTYPHTDFYETGQRAARLLLRIVAGEVKPVTAKIYIRRWCAAMSWSPPAA